MDVKVLLVAVLFSVFLFSGCITTEVQPEEEVTPEPENETEPPVEEEPEDSELANPAAVYCEDMGYDIELREEAGGMAGYCSHEGNECEEWKLYRGECCLTPEDCQVECVTGAVDCVEGQCVCPEDEVPPYETTDKTTSELLDGQLSKCNSWFFGENPSGDYIVSTMKWTRTEGETTPDQVTLGGAGIENDILFEGEPIRPIVAMSFRVYSSESDAVSCGSAIFRAEDTVLDGYSDYSITFQPSFADAEIRKEMDLCETQEKINYVSGEEVISVYRFRCWTVE